MISVSDSTFLEFILQNSQASIEGSSSETDSLLRGECVDSEDEGKMLKGRQYVYKELVATEADYVRDLECVVNVSELAADHCWTGKFTHCAPGHSVRVMCTLYMVVHSESVYVPICVCLSVFNPPTRTHTYTLPQSINQSINRTLMSPARSSQLMRAYETRFTKTH